MNREKKCISFEHFCNIYMLHINRSACDLINLIDFIEWNHYMVLRKKSIFNSFVSSAFQNLLFGIYDFRTFVCERNVCVKCVEWNFFYFLYICICVAIGILSTIFSLKLWFSVCFKRSFTNKGLLIWEHIFVCFLSSIFLN